MFVITVIAAAMASFFFFFTDTAPTEIYTLSLHDALPIWLHARSAFAFLLQGMQSFKHHCSLVDIRFSDNAMTEAVYLEVYAVVGWVLSCVSSFRGSVSLPRLLHVVVKSIQHDVRKQW